MSAMFIMAAWQIPFMVFCPWLNEKEEKVPEVREPEGPYIGMQMVRK